MLISPSSSLDRSEGHKKDSVNSKLHACILLVISSVCVDFTNECLFFGGIINSVRDKNMKKSTSNLILFRKVAVVGWSSKIGGCI